MSAIDKVRIAESALDDAKTLLAEARAELELEFRQELVNLFNKYGFSIEATGSEGSRLELFTITHPFTLEQLDL